MEVIEDKDFYIFQCPNCEEGGVMVHKNEVNCKIFRHAVMKNNFSQINPHTPKEVCDKLKKDGQILGCGKPFRFVYSKDGKHRIEKCGYI